MVDRLGQQLGHYHIIRLIGQGGFGEVYLGEHVYLKTQAAIKVLQVRLANEDIEGFLNEARTIAGLKHSHIVRVLDFGIEEGTPFLVMDYAPHGTLRQHYPRGTHLPLTIIVSYVKQVADALQYAHDRKLVHRDVKPENMLLGENNEVLLSDFGIALVTQSSHYQSTKEVLGTAAYMAPEQLQGKPRPASDQYALGIIVYEWLCGERPFHGTFTELYSQHMFVPPPPLQEKIPGISQDIEQVVMTALAKDPQQRFKSVAAFATALEQSSLTIQHHLFPSQSQPLEPTVVAPPYSQHVWPTVPTPSSSQPSQSGVMRTPPIDTQPTKQGISRRSVLAGLAGLAIVGIAGSITWLALSHASSGSPSTSVSTTNQIRTISPTPTPTRSPIGTTLYTYQGHVKKIRALAWSPNGKRIATASDDYTARVWDAMTGGNAVVYREHSSFVEGVAWSPDSRRVVSGSADGTAQIWDAATGRHISTYRGHSNWVNRVSWSANGTRIVSCDQSGAGGRVVTVQVWDASTGNTITTYRGHTNGVFAVAWSPDNTRIASAGYDGTLQIWDANTGNTIAAYRGQNMFLFGLSWSPDGKHVAVGNTNAVALVLDANTGNVILTYRGHSNWVIDVAWSPDGTRIASASMDKTVQVWNALAGQGLYLYNKQPGAIAAVGWSPDSQLVASGDDEGDVPGSVQVWQAV